MEIKAKIIKIGTEALSALDPMVILFDETATAALEKVAVIQQFDSKTAEASLDLKTGDQIVIGAIPFDIHQVGTLVQTNLTSIGHVTLIFKEPTVEDKMQSAIYLTNPKHAKPDFKSNEVITYRF